MTLASAIPETPWLNEPDRELWKDTVTGLDCLIRRGPSGALCGYVAVGPAHPLYGQGYWGYDYADEWDPNHPINQITVHGGLTYAAPCDGDKEQGICHVPGPGEPDEAWWFGFDCAHGGDICPAHIQHVPAFRDDVYRDFEYVRGEVTSLAKQLAEVA